MKTAVKILLADDHPIFLKGLIDVLQEEMPDCEIDPFSSPLEALQFAIRNPPDIAILDLDMPEMNGLQLTTKLKSELPSLKIIILTMHKEPDIIRSILAKGSDGYVIKDDAVNELVTAIKKVLKGGQFISTPVMKEITSPDQTIIQSLTKTENNILKQIALQKSSREIAEELFVSIKTIENHRNNISRKLKLQGSNSLLKFALDNKEFI
ncbi:MAG: response regulator transcription factor [Cyclobacteriaceae bacterium]